MVEYKKEFAALLSPVVDSFEGEVLSLIEIPKDEKFGDFAFPCFTLAKAYKKAPALIAQDIVAQLDSSLFSFQAVGPYVNATITDARFIPDTISLVLSDDALIPSPDNKTILVESPSPNTNKPLHLGHLRNMLLGQTLVTLLNAIGNKAYVVNVVNDRGIHICKSMLAYQKWGRNSTPQSARRKADHFVGDWYVRFNQEAAQSPLRAKELEEQAQNLLLAWERGDEEVVALWKKMNAWAYQGWQETFEALDFVIDKNYFESETYLGGKDIIMQGVQDGLFTKDESGAIIVDLTKKGLGKKVLLRSNGTSVYITQDINLAKVRFEDFTFDDLYYVVGNEQEYHFKVLFEVMRQLGWSFADSCHHFSYGMVELPDGKMKSREGNIVDTDDLLHQVVTLAREELQERYPDLSDQELTSRSKAIGLGALRFFFLKQDPLRNFVFNPRESVSFDGETGPYVQYTHARLHSILRKSTVSFKDADLSLLNTAEDKHIVKQLSSFGELVVSAARSREPQRVTSFLIGLCQLCNSYYYKHLIIQENKELEASRCALIAACAKVIKVGLDLLGIQALERM